MKEIASHKQSNVHLELERNLMCILLNLIDDTSKSKQMLLTQLCSILEKQYIYINVISLADIQKRNHHRKRQVRGYSDTLWRHNAVKYRHLDATD